MKLEELKKESLPIIIKGGKFHKKYEVIDFNQSCLLLRLKDYVKVNLTYSYIDTYLPTVFLDEYELVIED